VAENSPGSGIRRTISLPSTRSRRNRVPAPPGATRTCLKEVWLGVESATPQPRRARLSDASRVSELTFNAKPSKVGFLAEVPDTVSVVPVGRVFQQPVDALGVTTAGVQAIEVWIPARDHAEVLSTVEPLRDTRAGC
jgi:hypothetical protein